MTRLWIGKLYILGWAMLKACHAVSSCSRPYGELLKGDFGMPAPSQVSVEIGTCVSESETTGGVIGGVGGTTGRVGGTTGGVGGTIAAIGATVVFVGIKVKAACCAAGSRRTSAPCTVCTGDC